MPLAVYVLGAGLIASAERGIITQVTAPLRSGFDLAANTVKPFGQVLKYPAVGLIGVETLLNTGHALNTPQLHAPAAGLTPSVQQTVAEPQLLGAPHLTLERTLPVPDLQLQPSMGTLQPGFGRGDTVGQLQKTASK